MTYSPIRPPRFSSPLPLSFPLSLAPGFICVHNDGIVRPRCVVRVLNADRFSIVISELPPPLSLLLVYGRTYQISCVLSHKACTVGHDARYELGMMKSDDFPKFCAFQVAFTYPWEVPRTRVYPFSPLPPPTLSLRPLTIRLARLPTNWAVFLDGFLWPPGKCFPRISHP